MHSLTLCGASVVVDSTIQSRAIVLLTSNPVMLLLVTRLRDLSVSATLPRTSLEDPLCLGNATIFMSSRQNVLSLFQDRNNNKRTDFRELLAGRAN